MFRKLNLSVQADDLDLCSGYFKEKRCIRRIFRNDLFPNAESKFLDVNYKRLQSFVVHSKQNIL